MYDIHEINVEKSHCIGMVNAQNEIKMYCIIVTNKGTGCG